MDIKLANRLPKRLLAHCLGITLLMNSCRLSLRKKRGHRNLKDLENESDDPLEASSDPMLISAPQSSSTLVSSCSVPRVKRLQLETSWNNSSNCDFLSTPSPSTDVGLTPGSSNEVCLYSCVLPSN